MRHGTQTSAEPRFGFRRNAWGAIAAALLLVVSTSALANGRYPLADQIVIDPRHPDHLVARATFGLLDSNDGGQSFRWICEKAVGYFGVEDPPIAVTASGTIVVTSSKGLSVSSDGGCTWVRNPGLSGTWYGVDVTVPSSQPHHALAVISNFVDGAYTVAVVKSIDDGMSWSTVADSLGAGFLATTIEVAPSHPDRIYVSGKLIADGTAVIMRSDDGGHTWASFPIELSGAYSIYIAAVDPRSPDVVYVRTHADDVGKVLVSRDGAMSWKEVWQAPDDVGGFALSHDGTLLAVGGSSIGVSVADTTDFVFRRTSNAGAYCLTFWGDRLLVCTKEAVDHFSIGVSDDLGEHFSPLLHLRNVLPRACGDDSTAAVCAFDWKDVAVVIGADAGSRGGGEPDAGPGANAEPRGCDCAFSRRQPPGARVHLAVAGAALVLVSTHRWRRRRSAAARS